MSSSVLPGDLISALLLMRLPLLGLKMLLPTPLPAFPSGEAWPRGCVRHSVAHGMGPRVARPPAELGTMAVAGCQCAL